MSETFDCAMNDALDEWFEIQKVADDEERYVRVADWQFRYGHLLGRDRPW